MPDTINSMIPMERIQQCIYLVRKHKVMFDSDLAQLYGVETGALVRAVKRNIERFPTDFMFQLTKSEYEVFLRCQTGISKEGRGGRRSSEVRRPSRKMAPSSFAGVELHRRTPHKGGQLRRLEYPRLHQA